MKNKNGFSMIELAVVISIMVIMAAITIPRYASYKNTKSMSYAKTQILNDVRYVQNYTLSTKKFSDGSSPTGGYGIHFQEGTSYIIFGDKIHGTAAPDPNHAYDSSYIGTQRELFETINLVNGVRIQDIKLTKSGVVSYPTSVDYVSVPPYGKVYIDGTLDNVTLEITYTNDASVSSVITINSAGFIS